MFAKGGRLHTVAEKLTGSRSARLGTRDGSGSRGASERTTSSVYSVTSQKKHKRWLRKCVRYVFDSAATDSWDEGTFLIDLRDRIRIFAFDILDLPWTSASPFDSAQDCGRAAWALGERSYLRHSCRSAGARCGEDCFVPREQVLIGR